MAATPILLADSGVQIADPALVSAWDACFLASQRVPGLVKVTCATQRKVDSANGPGLDSATLRFQGLDPAEVGIEIVVWTAEHLSDLDLLMSIVAPKKSKKPPQPFVLAHPVTDAAGVTAVVVERIDWLKEGPVPQSRMVTLGCKQWLLPKKSPMGVPTLNAPTVAAVEPAGAPSAPSSSGTAKGP